MIKLHGGLTASKKLAKILKENPNALLTVEVDLDNQELTQRLLRSLHRQFKVDDKVISPSYGLGIVVNTEYLIDYPILVEFADLEISFTTKGYQFKDEYNLNTEQFRIVHKLY